MVRCDKKIEAWELILKLGNKNAFFSNLGNKV